MSWAPFCLACIVALAMLAEKATAQGTCEEFQQIVSKRYDASSKMSSDLTVEGVHQRMKRVIKEYPSRDPKVVCDEAKAHASEASKLKKFIDENKNLCDGNKPDALDAIFYEDALQNITSHLKDAWAHVTSLC